MMEASVYSANKHTRKSKVFAARNMPPEYKLINVHPMCKCGDKWVALACFVRNVHPPNNNCAPGTIYSLFTYKFMINLFNSIPV